MENITLDAQIECLLFFKNEPMSKKKIMEVFKIDELKLNKSLEILREKLETRGLVLIETNSDLCLGTKKEMASFLQNFKKEEAKKELSKASLETLSIILYKNGATRAEVDYIRGVNSSLIIRNLLIRGLIEKTEKDKNSTGFIYKPTVNLLKYLGLTKIEELESFNDISLLLKKTDSDSENQKEQLENKEFVN